jgi:hypothetical protein
MLIITAASRPTFDRSEPGPVPDAPSTGCSRVASRSVSAVSSDGPSNASGVASAAYIRASERAVNTPLAAGISASWIRSVWPTSRMSSTTSAEYNGAYRSKRDRRRSNCNSRADAFGSTSSVAMRVRTSGGAPMYIWPSRPSGSTISRWSAWLTVRPVTRRISSPTSQPYVSAWYPERVPTSQAGPAAASNRVISSQSSSVSVDSASARTSWSAAWWVSRCRNVIASLPPAANSGQYLATGAS